jgi:hypothetical protein
MAPRDSRGVRPSVDSELPVRMPSSRDLAGIRSARRLRGRKVQVGILAVDADSGTGQFIDWPGREGIEP